MASFHIAAVSKHLLCECVAVVRRIFHHWCQGGEAMAQCNPCLNFVTLQFRMRGVGRGDNIELPLNRGWIFISMSLWYSFKQNVVCREYNYIVETFK